MRTNSVSNTADGYGQAIALSVFFHVVVIFFVTLGWDSTSHKTTHVMPRYVEAKLVTMTAASVTPPKTKSTKVIDLAAKRKQDALKKARDKKAIDKKNRAAYKSQQDKVKQLALKNAELEAIRIQEQNQRDEDDRLQKIHDNEQRVEQERRERETEFSQALANEEASMQEQQDDEQAQSYIGVIAALIEKNWSRPPSARRGMQCELSIQLIPNGEVVNVSIVQSSGNSAFDRSAEQAVKKVGRFDVVKTIDPVIFDRNFRQLRLRFNPQDLRL
jgi:colicin import membrane protein